MFAAASLTDAFTALGTAFEQVHPDLEVVFNFAGTPTLVLQVVEGSPADVIAAADETSLQRLVEEGRLARAPTVFAANALELVVAAGNPEGVTGLGDLGRPDLRVALGDERVPVGRYTATALARAGVTVAPASREPSVRSVLTRVALGEADVGVVYATDVATGGSAVEGVPIDAASNVVVRYPAAPVAGSDQPSAAATFVDFLRSPPAGEILRRSGFADP